MPDKNSLRDKISSFCKENLLSLEDTVSPVSDHEAAALLSESTPEIQHPAGADCWNTNEFPAPDETVAVQSAQNPVSEFQESPEIHQDTQAPCASNTNQPSLAQNVTALFDGRMRYVNKPVCIPGVANCAYIQVVFNPSPVFALFLNGQAQGYIMQENNEPVFYQKGFPLGKLQELPNGYLQYIPYHLPPQNQSSYPNQNYNTASATSYNFNINNIPANAEGIEAAERMVSSFISNVPETATEVNVDVGFSTYQSTESTVIDATLSDSNYTTLPFQKQ